MSKSLYRFKVRKWSDVNANAFDLVFLDEERNNQHYSSSQTFETIEAAHEIAKMLDAELAKDVPSMVESIRLHWPVDGPAIH